MCISSLATRFPCWQVRKIKVEKCNSIVNALNKTKEVRADTQRRATSTVCMLIHLAFHQKNDLILFLLFLLVVGALSGPASGAGGAGMRVPSSAKSLETRPRKRCKVTARGDNNEKIRYLRIIITISHTIGEGREEEAGGGGQAAELRVSEWRAVCGNGRGGMEYVMTRGKM